MAPARARSNWLGAALDQLIDEVEDANRDGGAQAADQQRGQQPDKTIGQPNRAPAKGEIETENGKPGGPHHGAEIDERLEEHAGGSASGASSYRSLRRAC